MRQFTLSVVALTAFAAMLTAAQADALNGASARNGNQCFTYSPNAGDRSGGFGYWGACPQTASVAAAPRRVRKHHSSR
jgi:hypothetical protein